MPLTRFMLVLAAMLSSACAGRLPPAPVPIAPPTVSAATSDQQLGVAHHPAPRLLSKVVERRCTLSFNDPSALANVTDAAQDSLARWSQYGPELCQAENGAGCWIYKQHCGQLGSIRFEEYPYGRFGYVHLSFEDLECIETSSTKFGRKQTDGGCSTKGIKHHRENRYASGHSNDHVQRLWVRDDGAAALFSVDQVRVLGERGDRVAISYKTRRGHWRAWHSLPPGRYDFSDWSRDIVEMRFRGAEGTQSVAKIDDVKVRRLFIAKPRKPQERLN